MLIASLRNTAPYLYVRWISLQHRSYIWMTITNTRTPHSTSFKNNLSSCAWFWALKLGDSQITASLVTMITQHFCDYSTTRSECQKRIQSHHVSKTGFIYINSKLPLCTVLSQLKAHSLMLNRGRSQNCQNLICFFVFVFFAYFRSSPQSTLFRNQVKIILVWNESSFHRKVPYTRLYSTQ